MDENRIIDKLLEMEKRSDAHFDQIDVKFDKVFDKISETEARTDARFVAVDAKFDKVVDKLLDVEGRMGGFATQEKLDEHRREELQHYDEMITILQRLDQERIFTIERVKRIEEDVRLLKLHLKLA